MKRRSVALATSEAYPRLAPDDRHLLDALRALGARAEPVVWSRTEDWRQYDAVVVRSCWDYHTRFDEFIAWLDTLESAGVPMINDVRVLRWNARKRYLRDLESRGVRIVPTMRLDGDDAHIESMIAERGWADIVVKPEVSASAHDTWRAAMPLDAVARARLAEMRARGSVLVQPFVGAVTVAGEHSLVVLGGRFSHAVLKRPARDDFRVQEEHGGSSTPVEVDATVREAAEQIVRVAESIAGARISYARVDGVIGDDGLTLMELELIEPHLFFSTRPASAELLATEILGR